MLNHGRKHGWRHQQRRRMSGSANQTVSRRDPGRVFCRHLLVDPEPAEFTGIQRLSQGGGEKDEHAGQYPGKPGSAKR